MSFWGWFVLVLALVGFYVYSSNKQLGNFKSILGYLFIFFACYGVFGESPTESFLKDWALNSGYLDYDDVSIRKIEKLSNKDFDYKIYADIESGNIKCTVYLYVMLNSSETKVLNHYKDDHELVDAVIDVAKKRNPDWDW